MADKRCATCKSLRPRELFASPMSKSCEPCKSLDLPKWNKAKQSAYRYRADRVRVLEQNREWKAANELRYRSQQRAYTAAKRAERRALVLSHYGGDCACCGESEPLFLTIDHIEGNGNAHRREIGRTDMWIWLHANDFPEGFQILCFNCNAGRYRNGGTCPHRVEESDRGARRRSA